MVATFPEDAWIICRSEKLSFYLTKNVLHRILNGGTSRPVSREMKAVAGSHLRVIFVC